MDEHLSRYLERELSPRERREANTGAASKRNAVLLLFVFLAAYGCMTAASNSLDQAVAIENQREQQPTRPGNAWDKDATYSSREAAARRANYEERVRAAEREAAATWQNDPTSYGSD